MVLLTLSTNQSMAKKASTGDHKSYGSTKSNNVGDYKKKDRA